MMGKRLTNIFMLLFCEKNSDKTKSLRLKGNELQYRIGKRIGDEDVYKIANFLITNICVSKVELAYNNIGDDGFQVLVDTVFSHTNNIEHLSLVGCDITHKAVKKLCDCWPTLRLKTLRLTGNKIGLEGAIALEKLLVNTQTLENLDVGDTNQTLAGLPVFCGALRSDHGANETVKVLDISNIIPMNKMYQTSPMRAAVHIGEMIKMNSHLVELHIQKCQLDGHDVGILLNGLQYNTVLLLLDLGFNRMNNLGAELLSQWMKTRPNLVGLNISGNTIGNLGAVSLSFGLPFTKIRLLDISHNKINDAALETLLLTIKKEYRMRLLYLWGNRIGQRAIKVMKRHLSAGVYEQDNVDFKLYPVGDGLEAAENPINYYKNRYYCQLQHNEVRELRIKRNRVDSEYCRNKAKINFVFVDRMEGNIECAEDIRYEPFFDEVEFLAKCLEKDRLKKELEWLECWQKSEPEQSEEVAEEEEESVKLNRYGCPVYTKNT